MSPDPLPWEPRWPRATALLVCTLAVLTLLWPLLTGQILFGGMRSDMFIAGYSFRLFGAEQFLTTGAIPQWNPYLYGGLPYIAAMHGDIFYPTAWLRWIMPVDLAITWGMAVHFVLAGWLTFGFARALRLSWSAAIAAAVAYQLSGIVASQMSPGHDGKLFVSALTPLAFWVLLAAIRGAQRWAFGAFALVVALLVLGHYQMCYFLMLALGLWTLYLAFWDDQRPAGQNPWLAVGLALVAVVVGIGITALQVLPFLEYIPYSPRAAGGPNTGWEWVNSYAMPPAEVFTWVLPEFNGVLDNYWGENPIKFHTEYVGVVPLILACFAWGDAARRRLVVALLVGVVLFQLLAFAGHTPFYRPFFEFLPMLKKMRAVGMVFFLVAFPLALLAGHRPGADHGGAGGAASRPRGGRRLRGLRAAGGHRRAAGPSRRGSPSPSGWRRCRPTPPRSGSAPSGCWSSWPWAGRRSGRWPLGGSAVGWRGAAGGRRRRRGPVERGPAVLPVLAPGRGAVQGRRGHHPAPAGADALPGAGRAELLSPVHAHGLPDSQRPGIPRQRTPVLPGTGRQGPGLAGGVQPELHGPAGGAVPDPASRSRQCLASTTCSGRSPPRSEPRPSSTSATRCRPMPGSWPPPPGPRNPRSPRP